MEFGKEGYGTESESLLIYYWYAAKAPLRSEIRDRSDTTRIARRRNSITPVKFRSMGALVSRAAAAMLGDASDEAELRRWMEEEDARRQAIEEEEEDYLCTRPLPSEEYV